MHKSEGLNQMCLANDWKTQIVPEIPESGEPSEIVWNLYAVRGKETLQVTWLGNRMEGATYTYGESYRLSLWWRNQVAKLITGKPDPRKLLRGAEKKEGGSRAVTQEIEEGREVPWQADTPAIEILLAVLGKQVTWVRRIDGEILSDVIDHHSNQGSKYFRVIEMPPNSGQRVLEWTNTGGFHAVRLDAIVDVS